MALPLLLLALYLHPPTFTLPESPPPLSDLNRFPSAAVCDYQLEFLAARSEWLYNLHGLYRQPCYEPWFDAAKADIEERREPWQALHRAQQGCDWEEGDPTNERDRVTYSRCKLAELRRLLGAREFEAGAMPGLCGPEFWRRAD